MRPTLILLVALLGSACGSSDSSAGGDEPNHAIVVKAQGVLSEKVRAADALIAKVPVDKQVSYGFARHAALARKSAQLDAQSAKITSLINAKLPVPAGVLVAMSTLVDGLRDDASTIQAQHDAAVAKALAAQDAAYHEMVLGIASASLSVLSAIDTWQEASATVPTKTSVQTARGKLAFIGNDIPATWNEGLLPGDTNITVDCTSPAGPATVTFDAFT